MTDISNRKDDHISLAMNAEHQGVAASGFDQICFEHNPLPELALNEISTQTQFLGVELLSLIHISEPTRPY